MPWIDTLLRKMVEEEASDLHLTSGRKPMFRLHGDMVEVSQCPVIGESQMVQIFGEILPEPNRVQFESDSDTDYAYELDGVARFRVNMFRDNKGVGGVMRVIPAEILTAEMLGLPPAVLEFCLLSKGLVVVTGPTGSGKSTTLAAMVDHINNTRCDHIITIEDPIEFVHKDKRCLVNQRQVGQHTESFKRALRAALREDPDIVLVGEMRDLETIEIALETAETGHLVFGTLHTTTAVSTVDRIIDQFPADRQAQIRTMLSSSLKGVVAQTLCKKKPKGRCAALEVMVVNGAISAQIREGKTHHIASAMQTGGRLGMKLLNDSLCELVGGGKVDPLEAYIKAVDKEGLKSRYAEMGIAFDPTVGDKHAGHAPAPGPAPAAAPTMRGISQASAPAPLPNTADAAPAPSPAPSMGGMDDFEAFKRGRQ